MTISICYAPRHGTASAYRRDRCRCPEAIAAERRRNQRDYERRTYIKGRPSNRCGSRTGIDEVAVQRAVGGDRSLRLTVAERRVAIDALDGQGLTAAQVAVRLGITTRTVARQRARRAAQTQEVSAR